jgi:hypothetical protein
MTGWLTHLLLLLLLGICFWREGFEAAFGPEQRGEKGVAGERGAETVVWFGEFCGLESQGW